MENFYIATIIGDYNVLYFYFIPTVSVAKIDIHI